MNYRRSILSAAIVTCLGVAVQAHAQDAQPTGTQATDLDTVVVTGGSTSGCVRATAVDALSHGYRTIVPIETCADKHESYHFANLTDLQLKYADVEPVPADRDQVFGHELALQVDRVAFAIDGQLAALGNVAALYADTRAVQGDVLLAQAVVGEHVVQQALRLCLLAAQRAAQRALHAVAQQVGAAFGLFRQEQAKGHVAARALRLMGIDTLHTAEAAVFGNGFHRSSSARYPGYHGCHGQDADRG